MIKENQIGTNINENFNIYFKKVLIRLDDQYCFGTVTKELANDFFALVDLDDCLNKKYGDDLTIFGKKQVQKTAQEMGQRYIDLFDKYFLHYYPAN